MKLGSHNSMSYLKPKKWYLTPFRFVAKCQSKSIEEQFKAGVRMFDIRVSYDKYGIPEFRHGSMAFKGNVDEVFKYLNTRRCKVYVRLILEISNKKNSIIHEGYFIKDCKIWEEDYKKIVFFCGRRKFDWKIVYDFKYKEPNIVQYVGSMQGSKLNGLWPWLYAKLHNKKHYKECNKNKWALFDFIEIK